jgi:hypothetical protein
MTTPGWLHQVVDSGHLEPGVIQLLDSQARPTGGGQNFLVQDGQFSSWQVGALSEEEKLEQLAKKKAVIRVDEAVLMKGYQIMIDNYTTVSEQEKDILAEDAPEVLKEEQYVKNLEKKGMMRKGKFIKDHPDYKL